jgi:hypothetical protein
MSGFSDLFLELRMTLDDPEAFNSKISLQLDPNLVDQLTAYAASRNVPLSQTVLKAWSCSCCQLQKTLGTNFPMKRSQRAISAPHH